MFCNLATGQIVNEVNILKTATGYDIEISFFAPLRYQQLSAQSPAKEFEIFLTAENFADPILLEHITSRTTLSWDTQSSVPLNELVYNGDIPASPSLIVRLSKPLPFRVTSSKNHRSIIISIEHSGGTIPNELSPSIMASQGTSMENLVLQLKSSDPRLGLALQQANQYLVKHNYSRAIALFTKVRDESSGVFKQRSQELIGVARLLNNQVAQAKAEFEKYLQLYPDGPGAQRVKQRLVALITAAQLPKQKLRKVQKAAKQDQNEWQTQFYGSFGQTYFRDQTTPEGEDTRIVRSDLANDLDFIVRINKGDTHLKSQFVGSYRKDFLSEHESNQFIPSIFWLSAEDESFGLSAKVGRQSRSSSGILGRFDGAVLGYQVNDKITFNGVFGYPVNYADKTAINNDVQFSGVNAEFDSIWEGWDLSAFYIQQDNHGLLDRRAVGGELRYRDKTKSVFTLLDYDLLYQDLNIFLLIGNWRVTDSNSVNLVVDYRNSPLLTTRNAIIGQGMSSVDQLLDSYTLDEIQQLARDRTARSRSVTAGVTHQFNQDWQIIGDINLSQFGSTPASGGVEALPGTDSEMMYSLQVIGNKVAFDSDTLVSGIRISDTTRSDNYSFNISWRVRLESQLRINPRLRVDYRKDKADSDTRMIIRPFIRIDYKIKKWLKFELDLGYEWHQQTFSQQDFRTTGMFGSIGYRMQF